MKAIITRFVGATNTKPARIIASDLDGNRITVPAEGELQRATARDAAHETAVRALCARMNWTGDLVWGAVKTGLVWVWLDTKRNPKADEGYDTLNRITVKGDPRSRQS